jgi:hypothetical protein
MASNTPTLPSTPAPTPASTPTVQRTDTVIIPNESDSQGSTAADYGLGSLYDQSEPPAAADKGKEREQRNASPGPSNPVSPSTAAARRYVTDVGLRTIGPIGEKKKLDAKAEMRALHREIHSVTRQTAEHVRYTHEQLRAHDDAIDSASLQHLLRRPPLNSTNTGIRNQIAGVQLSLAENGVATVAGDPVYLSLAIANDPLIQTLVNGHNTSIANDNTINARLTAIESTQQRILQRLDAIAAQPQAIPPQPPVPVPAVAVTTPAALTTPAAPPPYSAPDSATPATTAQGATPVALPDVGLHGPSSTSMEGRMGAMEGVLQQLVAGMKRARSPSPDGPTRSIRAHTDNAPAHSIAAPTDTALAPPQPVDVVQNAHVTPLPAINRAAVAAPPGVVHAPAVIAPPASAINAPAIAAPPAGIVHTAAASALPAGIVHVTSTQPASAVHAPAIPAPTTNVHIPAASATTSGLVSVVAAPAGGRPRRNNNASSRNRAAEVRLGPVVWGQDITFEAGEIIRAVLRDYDLSTVFSRAYRIQNEPLRIECGFQTPAHATWFMSMFNASRVPPYDHVFASPN